MEGGKAEKGEQGKGGSYQERTRKLWLLWPSRTRRSEQKELEKRENKQLKDEEKGKNEKKLAHMLDENEVDQLETNNLMTAPECPFFVC